MAFALISFFFTSIRGYGDAGVGRQAYRALHDSARLISECQPENSILLIRDALREFDPKQDPEAASDAYFLLGDMNVSLKNSLESQKKLAEFQASYDLEIKQQENEILRRDQEISIKRHTVTILIFSTAGLFLGMLLLALFFLLKNNQNKRLLAEKENEHLRQDFEAALILYGLHGDADIHCKADGPGTVSHFFEHSAQ